MRTRLQVLQIQCGEEQPLEMAAVDSLAVGDLLLARWPEDGRIYRAKVDKIMKKQTFRG